MPRYRVIVRGTMSNAPLRGFYAQRTVESSGPGDAAEIAMHLVRNDPRIPEQMTQWGTGHPVLTIDETIEIGILDEPGPGPLGFVWFDESEQES